MSETGSKLKVQRKRGPMTLDRVYILIAVIDLKTYKVVFRGDPDYAVLIERSDSFRTLKDTEKDDFSDVRRVCVAYTQPSNYKGVIFAAISICNWQDAYVRKTAINKASGYLTRLLLQQKVTLPGYNPGDLIFFVPGKFDAPSWKYHLQEMFASYITDHASIKEN